jgi:hypothetical protein
MPAASPANPAPMIMIELSLALFMIIAIYKKSNLGFYEDENGDY